MPPTRTNSRATSIASGRSSPVIDNSQASGRSSPTVDNSQASSFSFVGQPNEIEETELDLPVIEENNRFRLEFKRILLTYPNATNISLDSIFRHLNNIYINGILAPLKYMGVTETHQNGELHHHVLIEFDKRPRSRT